MHGCSVLISILRGSDNVLNPALSFLDAIFVRYDTRCIFMVPAQPINCRGAYLHRGTKSGDASITLALTSAVGIH